MEWRDQGFILNVRGFGETSAIIEVFTPEHGRHAGVVRGGASRKMTPILQPGTQVDVEWRARLEDHLGNFRIEPLQSRSATIMADRASLAGLNAVCGLLSFSLPEREPHPRIYELSAALLDILGHKEEWADVYLKWELVLLNGLGFGLDLESCTVTGVSEDLLYVSPKTGRAVSKAGAGEWVDRLLPYPDITGSGDILPGLKTTGYFLEHWLAHSLGDKPLPDARARLVAVLAKNRRGKNEIIC